MRFNIKGWLDARYELLKILIIEDDVNIARLIELELGYEGYQVSVAHEG